MATVVTRHSFNQSTAASNPSVNALKQRTVGWPALTLSTGTTGAGGRCAASVKQQYLDLDADRTSTHWMASNQLRQATGNM
jgi:hypothetical protein